MKFNKGLAILICFFGFVMGAAASQVDSATAASAVRGWLQLEHSPLEAKLGNQIKSVETFKDKSGVPLYHVVYLQPSGFVIVSAEDQTEPIIAFVSQGRFDPSENNPLGALVSRDLPNRVARARNHANTVAGLKNHGKWQKLTAAATTGTGPSQSSLGSGAISDMRIAPFVATSWNQWTADNSSGGSACYNYFTPPFAAGSPTNVVCGCVATSLAQLMDYYQYPSTGVGTASFVVSFDGNSFTRPLRGGDGLGGPYDWANMPADTSAGATALQCQAIGALTYDAGVAVHMQYSDTPAGSGAYMSDAETALKTTFKYGNAILTGASSINVGYDLYDMINPDLDAHMPVIFGIVDTGGNGHCVICDGYGYSQATLYHHLNMGWGGVDNAWYQLPIIDISDTLPFYNFDACLYNVYTNGGGEIISGRVLDTTGNPIAGASVTGISTKGGVFTNTTDANGIYALVGMPSSSTCIITVTNTGCFPATSNIVAGLSADNGTNCGNVWGANFTLAAAIGAPVIATQPASQTVTVGSNAVFSTYATGQLPLAYQWQYQQSGTLLWFNLTDDGTNNGTQTPALTISPVDLSMNGEPLQCVITNFSGSATTVTATLTVNAAPFISLSTVAGLAGTSGTNDGVTAAALFNDPCGIAIDSHTNIFVADKNNHTIRMMSPTGSGWSVVTIAGSAGNSGTNNGTGSNARFNAPYGVAVDNNGNVYVADTGNNTIRELTPYGPNWLVSTIAGQPGPTGANIDGFSARFNHPVGVAVDNNGIIYVADNANHNIRKITFTGSGWLVNTIAGSGTFGSNDGTNNNAQFGQPYGICVNTNNGVVFVADEYNQTIRQLTLSGANWLVTTIAGTAGASGSADGAGSAARFKFPTGIAVGVDGNLYVADNGNNTIRRLSLAGTNWNAFTAAGVAGSSGSLDGFGNSVLMNGPFGIAVDSYTNVYVSDSLNDTIRGGNLTATPLPSRVHLSKQSAQSRNASTITWSAMVGHTYLLQYKTNLNQSAWSNLSAFTATNWTGVITVPEGSDPQRFYRVIPNP